MKHTIILLCLLLALAGSGYAAFRLHREYIGQQTANAAHTAFVQAQQASEARKTSIKAQQQLEMSIAKLEAACKRNYDNIPAATKAHIPASGCTLL
jgi:hypothetical protein